MLQRLVVVQERLESIVASWCCAMLVIAMGECLFLIGVVDDGDGAWCAPAGAWLQRANDLAVKCRRKVTPTSRSGQF